MNTRIRPTTSKAALMRALLEGHARTQKELSFFLGLSISTANLYLRALQADGLVEVAELVRPKSGTGRSISTYAVTPAGEAALAKGLEFTPTYASRKERQAAVFRVLADRIEALEWRVAALELGRAEALQQTKRGVE